MPWVAENRTALRKSIFKFVYRDSFEQQLYQFVYATKNPLLVCMKRVYDAPMPAEDSLLGGWLHSFRISSELDFSHSDEAGAFGCANNHVHVLLEPHTREGQVLSSDSWEPLASLLMRLPWLAHGPNTRSDAPTAPARGGVFEGTLPPFLEAAIPEYADWCFVDAFLHTKNRRCGFDA